MTSTIERTLRSPGKPPKRKDPVMRKNKKCYVCGNGLTELVLKEGDPFCSTQCARNYHGLDASRVSG